MIDRGKLKKESRLEGFPYSQSHVLKRYFEKNSIEKPLIYDEEIGDELGLTRENSINNRKDFQKIKAYFDDTLFKRLSWIRE